MNHNTIEEALGALVAIVSLVGPVVGLMIRNAILKSSAEIRDLVAVVHSEVKTHNAEDGIIHREHDRRITQLERA